MASTNINRRQFLAVSTLAATAVAQTQKPNIVYFLADDFGYGDAGFQNPKSKIPTPNLDRLAAHGVHFSDAHDPTAVCTPTRYGILTGRYCWRSRLKKGVLLQWDKELIETDRLTVPAMLKTHGYRTAAFGKWHLGFEWATTDGQAPKFAQGKCNVDFSKPVADGPTSRGFDYFFGMDCPNYPPYCYIENDRLQGNPTAVFEGGNMQKSSNPAFGPIDSRPGPAMPGWKQEDVLPEITTRAAKYIEERGKNPKEPFFVYFACTGPHTPVVPAKEFQGKTKVGPYGDWVNQVDHSLGQLLDALERAGLSDNTLVIFTSDNGPEKFAYERVQEFGHYSMGDLRGVKRDAWEGGHRVPWVARWPGKIKAGSSSSEVICQTDLMATVAAVVGHKLPEDAGEDSYNVLPAIMGQELTKPIREATVHHSADGFFAIRQGPWVFIDNPTGDNNKEPDWMKKERGYQPHNHPGELYDLRTDLQERTNLYAERPEIVRSLKELLEKYKRDGRSVLRN
jgi:arylsulfatase A-like enzyme